LSVLIAPRAVKYLKTIDAFIINPSILTINMKLTAISAKIEKINIPDLSDSISLKTCAKFWRKTG
jgi:hypothetical protein